MGWLADMFGGRKRREDRRRAAEGAIRELLERRGPDAAWRRCVAELSRDPEAGALLHVAAEVLRRGGEAPTAELFDRAADAPHDPQRLFELGSSLLSHEQPEVAAILLERALAFVPFDAVVRSELALAQARAGRPDRVLEVLALHPCLAEDRGALFEFGWAALLTGDLEAAEGALGELTGAPALRRKLELALRRARLGDANEAPDARHYYFVEHGGLVLDADGPWAGRYDELALDSAWVAGALSDLGWFLRTALARPRHVIAIDEEHEPLAEAVAAACEGDVWVAGRTRPPAGVLPLWSGAMIEQRLDETTRRSEGLWLFAATVDWSRSLARAPELVGAFARRVEVAPGALQPDALAPAQGAEPAPRPDLAVFVESRRAMLPPEGSRVRSAYLPDAPLPRPAAT